MTEHLLPNRLRCFRTNFTTAVRTERVRNARPEKFQIIVDLRHCPDGGSGSLDGVRLLNGDRGRDAADIIDARLVHSIEELPHIRTEGFDVTSLAFGVNRLECQTRFAAAARSGDDGQFSQRKIDIDAFEIVLACAANLNAIIRRRRDNPLFVPDLRTHYRQFQIVRRFANFPGSARRGVLRSAAGRPVQKRGKSGVDISVRYGSAEPWRFRPAAENGTRAACAPRKREASATFQTPRLVARAVFVILPAPRRLTNRK